MPHFLDEIKTSQLSDKLMQDFFTKLTERNESSDILQHSQNRPDS